ncbi:hypothetical protein H5410_048801 [Solanum commersonii]|uniref:S-protein homolog n=1 Tax=Solanum commersonii TaxID=4109 RepID=A0A9J5XLK1_SOLCO|nr:hypothetical protein H5410_048801 [Solanum commersonii]
MGGQNRKSNAKICITEIIEKDDDLGIHPPIVNEDYHWRFCAAFTDRTLSFCRFLWGDKYRVFDVYSSSLIILKVSQFQILLAIVNGQ